MMPKKIPVKYCQVGYCKDGIQLIPKVSVVSGFKDGDKMYTNYRIDHWYCPHCGLMYHFPDLETITEEED